MTHLHRNWKKESYQEEQQPLQSSHCYLLLFVTVEAFNPPPPTSNSPSPLPTPHPSLSPSAQTISLSWLFVEQPYCGCGYNKVISGCNKSDLSLKTVQTNTGGSLENGVNQVGRWPPPSPPSPRGLGWTRKEQVVGGRMRVRGNDMRFFFLI